VLFFFPAAAVLAVGIVLAVLAFSELGVGAGGGVLLITGGYLWELAIAFQGNVLGALLIILVPFLPLRIKFLVDNWRELRWPFLCQVIGFAVLLISLAGAAARHSR
jgi:hypothetical protein